MGKKKVNTFLAIVLLISLIFVVYHNHGNYERTMGRYFHTSIEVQSIKAQTVSDIPTGYKAPEDDWKIVKVTYHVKNTGNCGCPFGNTQLYYRRSATAGDSDSYDAPNNLERDIVGNGFNDNTFEEFVPAGSEYDYVNYIQVPRHTTAFRVDISSVNYVIDYNDDPIYEVKIEES